MSITYTEMSDCSTRMRNDRTDIDGKLTECNGIGDTLADSDVVADSASAECERVHTDFVNSDNTVMNTRE